jgi:hypothetical protein
VLFPGVVLGHHCTLARHCIVHGANFIWYKSYNYAKISFHILNF